MTKISLEGMEFFANHGYYDEEQKMGNKFGVDITLTAELTQAIEQDTLSSTINYEKIYQLVKEEINKPSRLLENLANRIINRVFDNFPTIRDVEISVSKFNPPIGGICNKAKVTLSRKGNGEKPL